MYAFRDEAPFIAGAESLDDGEERVWDGLRVRVIHLPVGKRQERLLEQEPDLRVARGVECIRAAEEQQISVGELPVRVGDAIPDGTEGVAIAGSSTPRMQLAELHGEEAELAQMAVDVARVLVEDRRRLAIAISTSK